MNLIFAIRRLIVLAGTTKTKLKYARKWGVKIGERCTILGRVEWGSEPYLIKIGDDVRITSGVQFVTHDGGMHVLRNARNMKDADLFGRIVIGNNVFIGIKSIIMPGVSIGNNVVIGAGSIVTKDVLDNTVVCGVPARPIKTLDEYYEKAKKMCLHTKGLPPKEKEKEIKNYFNII